MEEIDPHKCIARMWNKGCGGQCSRKRINGEYCKKHISEENRWCGILTEPPPRNPISPNGKINKWKCHKVYKQEPIIKQEPNIKEEPVQEEVVKEPVQEEVVKEEVKEEVQEEVQEPVLEGPVHEEPVHEEPVLEEPVKEEVVLEEDDTDDIVLQGELVIFEDNEYYRVIKSSKILDIHSLDEIGEWDSDNERIQFF